MASEKQGHDIMPQSQQPQDEASPQHQVLEQDFQQRSPSPADDHKHDDPDSKSPSTRDDESSVHLEERQNGVAMVEDMVRSLGGNRIALVVFLLCITCVTFCLTLQNGTYYQYQNLATSEFSEHGRMLSVIGVASSIVKACSQPTIAKISDVFSRQVAYIISLAFFVLGFVLTAAAPTANAYALGQILGAIGFEGIYLVTSILLADISPLKWRALANTYVSVWYIVTVWVASNIALDVNNHIGWRWGYGIFCIIMPVSMIPVICFLLWAQHKASKTGELNLGSSPRQRRTEVFQGSIFNRLKTLAIELDVLGLLMITTGWCVFLLPFSLASSASGGYKNPSIIAMLVTGPIILMLFGIYEWKFSPKPLVTHRIAINRCFQLAVTIDFFFYLTGYLRVLYYLSWVYGVTNWSYQRWSYFANLNTFLLTLFGVFISLFIRWQRRYKNIQIFGLCLRTLAMGLHVYGTMTGGEPSLALLIWHQLLNTFGSSCSTVGTQLATQASVPHQDLGQIIAQLSLWTQIGGGVGDAIAGAVWTSQVPKKMVQYGIPAAQAKTLVGSNKAVHALPWGSPTRLAAIRAYNESYRPLVAAATALMVIPIICALFMPNYYLGDQHNVVEDVDVMGRKAQDTGPKKQSDIVEEEHENGLFAKSKRLIKNKTSSTN